MSLVEVEIPESAMQETSADELFFSDKQRECSNCQCKWNSIHIFKNKAGAFEIAFGVE